MLRTRTFGDSSSFIVAGFLHSRVSVLDLEDPRFRFARGRVFLRGDLDGGLVIWTKSWVSRASFVSPGMPRRTHLCDRRAWSLRRLAHCTVALDGLLNVRNSVVRYGREV